MGTTENTGHVMHARQVDVRLPGQGNSSSHGARPIHLIITMIQWIRTSRLSIKNSFYVMLADSPQRNDASDLVES